MKIQSKQLNIPQGKVLIGTADSNGAASSYTFPPSDGSANQILQTDGSGALSFVDQSSGGLSNIVEDTSPQLGGTLETGTHSIKFGSGNYAEIKAESMGGSVHGMRFTIDNSELGNTNASYPEPAYVFESTQTTAGSGPQIMLFNKRSMSANNSIALIDFKGYTADSSGNFLYSRIKSKFLQGSTASNRTAELSLSTYSDGTSIDAIKITGNTSNQNVVTGISKILDVSDHNGSSLGLKLGSTLVTSTAAELNLLDGGTSAVSTTLVDADRVIVNDSGTMKQVALSDVKTYVGGGGAAADDITAGDAAVSIATTAGDITIDAQGNDTDIIFKGTDGNSDITMLTLDGSEAGAASFNSSVTAGGALLPSAANTHALGSASAEWADLYLGDSSKIYFGNDQDVRVQHTPDEGLTLLMGSGSSADPRFTLYNSHDSSSSYSLMRFQSYSTSPANNDTIMRIDSVGQHSGGASHIYSGIFTGIENVTDGSEAGSLYFRVASAGGTANNSAQTGLEIYGNASGHLVTKIENHDGANSGLMLDSTLVTSTAAEINFLDTSVKSPSNGDVLSYNGTSLAWTAPSAGGGYTYSAKDASFTAAADYHYSCTNAITATLPAASSNANKAIRIKVMGTGTVTIGRDGSDKIDGVASDYSMTIQYSSITLFSNGSDGWEII